HFPGHGDVGVDPHECLPVVNKSKEDLSQVELVPFAALAYKADTIMTAHIIIPALDTHYCATLSEKILGLLRNEMGFKGVIISDSLAMEGVLKNGGSIDEIAVLAFNAGCDILMLGGKQLIGANKGFELTISDVQRVHQHLVNAVKTGSIKEDRLNESVKRILDLKNQYHLFNRESPAFHEEVIRSPDHLNLAQKIATKALRTSKHCSISAGAMTIVAPQMLKEAIDQISLQGPVLFFNEPNPTKEEVDFILASVKDHDSAVFFSYNAWKFPYQSLLLQSLLEAKKQVILVVTGDPLDSSLFSKANMVITTFSPSVASIRAASTVIIEAITSEDKE
ncbi:MAG: glycoside hydrolase family 3 protein, partial [Chlamydiales bacterium]|nr:glycoside hydrolase family 3 protein [Chlamydiales bacterium]